VRGQLVKTLVNEVQEAGEHELVWNAGDAASGVYFARLQTGSQTRTQKLLLLK